MSERNYMVEMVTVAFKLNSRDVSFNILQNVNWRYPTSPCYEPDVAHVMTRFVGPGDHVIDAGANWGYHTLLMSRLVGDDGIVWSVEPDKFASQFLHKNIQANKLGNVMVCEKPLWDTVEQKDFSCLVNDGSSSFTPSAQQDTITVNKTTAVLDELIPEGEHVRLLKIDCEGAEQKILRGAGRLLREGVDAVVLELNRYAMASFGWTTRSLRDYMNSLGYDFFLLNVNGLFPTYIPPAVNFDFDGCILNVLFSRMETVADLWSTVELTSLGPIYMGSYEVNNGCVTMIGRQ